MHIHSPASKNQPSNKNQKHMKITKRIVLSSLAGIASVAGLGLVTTQVVFADRFQDQINSLNNQNAGTRDNLGQLGAEAASLQDMIARLQAEIANLQAQIGVNEQQRDQTVAEIARAEAELARQRQFLGESLKAMYVDGSVSSLEMLASSGSINDFVDQEQYQNSVQSQIQRTLDSIKQMQAKLAADKAKLEQMIAGLQDMRRGVAEQQAEQARLLSLNQAQQAELDGQIRANNTKIADLRKQQAMENARLGGDRMPPGIPGGGGYPWGYVAYPSSTPDRWGMYLRECVSYTAWKVASSGRYMPYWGGHGNAKQWDDNALDDGIPVDGNPREGDVAVSNAGRWGHVMYVESVGSDGSIYVSDYNQQFDGNYREYWISAETVRARGLVFIHF